MENLPIYIAYATPFCLAFAYLGLKYRAEAGSPSEPVVEPEENTSAPRTVSKVYFG